MFYKEIFEQTGPGGAFLEHLEAETLKIYLVDANHNGIVSSMYVPVYPRTPWIRH